MSYTPHKWQRYELRGKASVVCVECGKVAAPGDEKRYGEHCLGTLSKFPRQSMADAFAQMFATPKDKGES